jgi:hypothetical protein
MGEELNLFPLSFNSSIHIEAREERLTADPGSVLLRETLDRLGIIEWLTERLDDPRIEELITHPLAELLRTELLRMALGWRDQDDADALRDDPALRLSVSDRRGVSPLATRPEEERQRDKNPEAPDGLASQPTLSRLARAMSSEENRGVLRAALLETVARRLRAKRRGHRKRSVTIDVDSLPIEVQGHQPGSAYNGHYHARIYHPLIALIAETGDVIDARLREGAAHTAAGALDFILPLLDEVEAKLCVKAAVRMDAGFPEERLLGGLEVRRTPYVARLRNNAVLDRMAEPYIRRPVGRRPAEPREWFYEATYQAESWSRKRRVVLVVQERADDLFLHHFWLVTSWSAEQKPGGALCEEYRRRGAAEGYMGEVMNVLKPALSSSPRPKSHYRGGEPVRRYGSGDSFAINETALLLNLLSYDVMHVTRVTMEEATGEGWSLQRLRERVLRVASRLVLHARRATLVIARGAAKYWRALLSEMRALRVVQT